MMIALVLSSNMKRMIKNNVLVRRMVGIETSGSISTLFTDKTGTLTKGKLEVVGVLLHNEKLLKTPKEIADNPKIGKYILENMLLNNESKLSHNNEILGGNITDKALLEFSKTYKSTATIEEQKYFDSTNKYSSVKLYDGNHHELIKGAPEILVSKIRDTYKVDGTKEYIDYREIERLSSKYSSLGYRVLLLCDKDSEYYTNLTFIALVLLKDEISDSAKEAVELIESAGSQVVMITGDSIDTAKSIAKEIGLLKSPKDLSLTSKDLSKMTDDEIKSIYKDIKIIARALPEDKSRLVKIGQSLGNVVGMTGDGINDAPALKCADVGFAMGTGSEVAKEASDIVILDNNLISIAKSILFGRTIFKSIRKFIIFQLTMNLCALTLSILGPFLNINTPITVMQMLWINMIMDTLAGLAFSFEPPLKEYMKYKPLKKNEKILNNYMYSCILITGVYTALLLIFFLKLPFIKSLFRFSSTNKYLMTAFFGLFVFSGILNSFNARTNRINIFSNITKNKPFIFIIIFIFIVQIFLLYKGGNTFRTYGLTIKEMLVTLTLSLTVIPIDTIRKLILRKTNVDITF